MESEHHWGHRQFPVVGEDTMTGLVIKHFCTGRCVPWMGDAVWGSDFDHAGRDGRSASSRSRRSTPRFLGAANSANTLEHVWSYLASVLQRVRRLAHRVYLRVASHVRPFAADRVV